MTSEVSKNHTPNIRKHTAVVFFLIAAIFVAFATSAWATLTLLKPHEISQEEVNDARNIYQISSTNQSQATKSRAPEPTTMALFGGGIIGMIVRFVRKSYAAVKRIFDVFASIVGLILLSPLCILTALLIKITSPGPISFKQTRVGKDGELFEIYKFRTMNVDAEKATGPVWAKANDDRLIPCGTFIRKAHIDEIPQFVNVLQGHMSIIGPRPERPVFVEKFKKEIADYDKRIAVKPGITGLAQVWHKYDESMEDVRKKIKYDLLYIRKLCLWTDLTIMFRTVRVVFTGEGAR